MASPARAPSGSALFDSPCGTLLHAPGEAIVMIDAGQAIVALNSAAEQLFGCSAAEALGTSIERFIPEPWRARHAALVQGFAACPVTPRALERGRPIEVLRSDGSRLPVEIALSRVEFAVGAVPGPLYAALLRDASELGLEAQMRQTERRLRAVFELSPGAIWVCEDDVLVYANRAAARLLGVESADQLIGRPATDLVDPGSRALLRQQIDRALRGQTAGALVAGRLLRADGQTREVEIALAALPDHGVRTVQMVVNDVTERAREAAELERSRRALRELSASVVEAREEERRRIARELHDELGQRLTALKIDLANLAVQDGLATDDTRVASMQAMLDETLASVRRIASDLRPLMLDDLGLNAAIEWLAREAARRTGIAVQTRLPANEPAADQRVATALYRSVQEALTNVARHARARSVWINLRQRDRSLVLTVGDDGVGLGDAGLQRPGSFGLLGLRERAHALGGRFEVGPRRGGGTQLSMEIPRHPGAADATP